jgi:hypothetical protein
MSLVSYSVAAQSIDGLPDVAIDPDPGSVNPFRAGADRTAAARDWRVRIVDARVPAARRAPNTLYLRDGARRSLPGVAAFALRIYQPDDGLSRTGGVDLPAIAQVRADGSRRTLRTCDQSRPQRVRPADPAKLERLLRVGSGIAPLAFRGHNPPVWRKNTNIVTAATRLFLANEQTSALGDRLSRLLDSVVPAGGLGENPDNTYIGSFYARGFGDVLLLRGRMPVTPRTRGGEPVMGTGQLRYWSLCTNAQDTSYYDCLVDDEVPLDAQRDYAIAVSPTRPANARPECAIAWLPSGPLPQSVLIVRNMLADAGFAESIQRATVGSEAATMGPYLPRGAYYRDARAFEDAVGCPGAGPSVQTSGAAPSS